MNQDANLDDFKNIDGDDQQLIHGWLEAGETPRPNDHEVGGRRKVGPAMTVNQEIIDRFISDPYLDPSDDAVVDSLINVMREQGMDPEALELDRNEGSRLNCWRVCGCGVELWVRD